MPSTFLSTAFPAFQFESQNHGAITMPQLAVLNNLGPLGHRLLASLGRFEVWRLLLKEVGDWCAEVVDCFVLCCLD